MLRRLKTNKDIIKDLPEKIIDNKFTTLSPTQGTKNIHIKTKI